VTELETYEAALRPRRRFPFGYVFATLLAVFALLVAAFAFDGWLRLEHARGVRAFEAGLARACLESEGVYSFGRCDPPPVQFKMVPLPGFAFPADPAPGVPPL
jgi:hypothetical protein